VLTEGNIISGGVQDFGDNQTFQITSAKENQYFFNASSWETESETFTVNITTNGSTPTSGELIYNGTTFSSATITNTAANDFNITRTIDIPLTPGTKTFFFNYTLDGEERSTTTQSQIINVSNFTFCGGAPQNIPFLNFSFKNETLAQEDTTASINFDITYWLGSGTVIKNLNFINVTENLNYTFCYDPDGEIINTNYSIDYTNSISQQRSFIAITILSNITTAQTLYLLPTTNGLFSQFKTTNINGDTISDVGAVITTVLGGSTITVASGSTDDSGFITFFLNPDSTYTGTFTKTGFPDNVFSFVPTSDLRTVIMGGGAQQIANGTIITRGLEYNITPTNTTLNNNTNITFGFNVTSNQTITLISMNITNSTNDQLLFTSTAGQGFISGVVNTTDNTKIIGRYLIQTANETITLTRIWIVGFEFEGDYSLYKQLRLFTDYGFSDFIRILMVILVIIGILVFMTATEITDSSESKIIVAVLLVWIFSVVGWLDTNLTVNSTNTGISKLAQFSNQFGIAILATAAGAFFIFRRVFIRRI
jgi:hypothetical protein